LILPFGCEAKEGVEKRLKDQDSPEILLTINIVGSAWFLK